MSITAETAKAHAHDPAVLCCRAEAGITIEPANLEDPAIFDDLTELGVILGKPLDEHFCQKIQEIAFNFAKQWDDKYKAFNVSLPPFGGSGPFFQPTLKND